MYINIAVPDHFAAKFNVRLEQNICVSESALEISMGASYVNTIT